MKPISFPEQTSILQKPESMTDEECGSLPIYSNGVECISLWELDEDELQQIIETKQVWLRVVSGTTQPPVLLQVEVPFQCAVTDAQGNNCPEKVTHITIVNGRAVRLCDKCFTQVQLGAYGLYKVRK